MYCASLSSPSISHIGALNPLSGETVSASFRPNRTIVKACPFNTLRPLRVQPVYDCTIFIDAFIGSTQPQVVEAGIVHPNVSGFPVSEGGRLTSDILWLTTPYSSELLCVHPDSGIQRSGVGSVLRIPCRGDSSSSLPACVMGQSFETSDTPWRRGRPSGYISGSEGAATSLVDGIRLSSESGVRNCERSRSDPD